HARPGPHEAMERWQARIARGAQTPTIPTRPEQRVGDGVRERPRPVGRSSSPAWIRQPATTPASDISAIAFARLERAFADVDRPAAAVRSR
ncbi:MAG TPA: hypothetical protein VLB47_00955, partial [Solirubrobacteraceae bacterium]|nr:hypothetical protein [Solirubrobacteraceae bacterium]